jgi:hypothetical protein
VSRCAAAAPEQIDHDRGVAAKASARVVGQERFPIKDFNTGYCFQGCATRVAPGEQISAFIQYVDFGLPERLVNAQKSLEFSPLAFRCESKR